MFLTLVLVFVFRGRGLFFVGQSLWSCLDCIQVLHFVLYLFQLLPYLFYLVGIFMLGGVYFFYVVLNCLLIYVYEFFIDICLYCVLLKTRFYFIYLYFFHTCCYAFCLSFSGNIQVDSIKLLSTFATDGQQLGLNMSFMNISL